MPDSGGVQAARKRIQPVRLARRSLAAGPRDDLEAGSRKRAPGRTSRGLAPEEPSRSTASPARGTPRHRARAPQAAGTRSSSAGPARPRSRKARGTVISENRAAVVLEEGRELVVEHVREDIEPDVPAAARPAGREVAGERPERSARERARPPAVRHLDPVGEEGDGKPAAGPSVEAKQLDDLVRREDPALDDVEGARRLDRPGGALRQTLPSAGPG